MKSLFRKEVYRHREQRLTGEVRLARPPSFVWLSYLIAGIVFFSIIWLAVGDYSRKETVRGMIQPDTGVLRVRAESMGTIKEILVEEGDRVSVGQPLIRIGTDRFLPVEGAFPEALADELRARLARIEQAIDNEKKRYELRKERLAARENQIESEIRSAETQIDLLGQRVAMNSRLTRHIEALSRQGHESDLELVRQQDSLIALQQEHESARANLANLHDQLVQTRLDRAEAPLSHQTELDGLQSRMEETREQLLRLRHEIDAEIRAPVDGSITGLIAYDSAQVDPGQTLMHLLPDDATLEAVLFVPTASMGLIEVGQRVRIRYDAFPYQRFGVHEGEISRLGRTALLPGEQEGMPGVDQPVYRVIVTLDESEIPAYGQSFSLRPGMQLEADVITERRSLLQWLFDPIYSIQRKL
jgi:membrane fusion protein